MNLGLRRSFSKELKDIPKDVFKDNLLKQSIKDLSMFLNKSIVKDNSLISVISNYLKDKNELFTQKGKFEINIFLLSLMLEFCTQINIMQNISKLTFEIISKDKLLKYDVTNKEKVTKFLKSFYDFYENKLEFTNQDFVNCISTNNNIQDSFIIALNKILLYCNKNGFSQFFSKFFLKESENFDIGIPIIKLLYAFHSIQRFVFEENNTYSEKDKKFINNAISYSFPFILDFLTNIILEYNPKNTAIYLVKKDEYCFFFNELSYDSELRKKILEMFKKNYYNEEQFKIISNYLQENKCLEGILSKIKQQYQFQNKSKQKTNFISEIKSIFLIKNEFNILDNEFIYDVVQFISHLIENSNDTENNKNNFYDDFIQQFVYDTLKNNTKNKNLKYDIINFLIDLLLNISDNTLKKKTFQILFEIINTNISNYKEIQLNTHLLDNLNEICNCDKEIVSYFFLFLMSIEGYYASIELKKIIESLNKYSNLDSLKTLFENIIKYHEKNSTSFIEFAKDLIPKLYEMIDNYVNKKKNVAKKEILECIIDFSGLIINKNPKIFIMFEDEKFKHLKFEQFFQPLINSNDDYSIGYKLIKIYLDNSNYEKPIRNIPINNLVNLILNKYAIITSQFEVENLPNTLNEIKNIYETLKNLFSKKKLKEPLNDNVKKCIYNLCDYLSKCKDDFNEEIHKTLKFYFEYIMSIIITHNENILKKNDIEYPEIYISEFKIIIYQIITLESELNNKNYLIDMIKFIIDYSLLIKQNINENEKLLNSDFKVIYCNKYIISSEVLKQSYNSQSNYTNFSLLTPLPILFTFKILSKLNKYLIEMLDFIIFLLEVNEGNIKMFLKANIIQCFFQILNDNFDSNKKINELILKGLSLLTKFLSKSLFQDLIEEILLFLNNKFNPDYMNIITEIIKILSKNIKLTSDFNIGIILTDYNVKQLNIFNNILISDLKYSNDIQTITIYQHYFFFSSIKSIDYYYLFKIENNKNFIEIYLKNFKLIVNDCKDEKNKIEISIYEILHLNENNSFIFNFNLLSNQLSISINNNVLLNYEYKYNFYDSKPHTNFIWI